MVAVCGHGVGALLVGEDEEEVGLGGFGHGDGGLGCETNVIVAHFLNCDCADFMEVLIDEPFERTKMQMYGMDLE